MVHMQLKVQRKRAESNPVAPYSKSFNRTLVGTIYSTNEGLGLVSTVANSLHTAFILISLPRHCDCPLQVDRDLRVGGWIKTGREAGGGSFAFLEVNDGSCLQHLQVCHVCSYICLA